MSTKPPPNEKNNLDALAKKGLHMLRCAPKIWDPSDIPKSTKTSITACRETAKNLYGSGLGDMEYSKRLTDDYVCWFYEIVNNTTKTYMYYRCKSQDKQRTGEILYKLMVKTWLRIFHPFPASHYVGLTCDINNPSFDPRIYEASKKPSNRSSSGRSSRQKKNAPVLDLEEDEDDDEDPIQESEDNDSFQRRSNTMIEDIEESNTNNSAKKPFANNKRKTVEDIEEASGEDTVKDASCKKYSTRPPSALNTTCLKEDPTNMVTFVMANPSYFREYSVDFCFFRQDCDDQMISRFKKIDVQHVGKIISLLDSTKSTEDILETLPKKTPPVRKLKPTKHNGTANPTVMRKLPIAQQKEVAKSVSYFKEENPTPPTLPTKSLSEMIMVNPWSTAPILNSSSRPRLPALINFKPETNFWKLMAMKNYLVSCYPMLCNVELTQPLSECNADQEKLLTIIFVNCFSKKKTIDNALLAKNILATCDIKFQNNIRVEIADAVYENDKLKYTFSSFAEHNGKLSPSTKKNILLCRQTHLNYICSDRHNVIEQLMKRINAKQWTIKPHEAVEALTDMTKFCQSLDLFLLQTFVSAMNSWFVPCIDLNIITSDATKQKLEKTQ